MTTADDASTDSGESTTTAAEEATVLEAMLLLEKGDDQIVFPDKHEKVILTLGVTGAGKTTMTQLISGDNKALTSYESPPKSNKYLIRDDTQLISEATIVSQTIFPKLVVDNDTGEALYDCPGFADTRNVSIEIANTYFIKKVAERSKSMKILLIAPYSSVCSGEDRSAFVSLMDLMLQFLKRPQDFANGAALLVTKVRDRDQTDAQVVISVVDFLQKFKSELNNIRFAHNRSNVDQLVDALLKIEGKGSEEEYYPNIQIFRQPVAAGKLSDFPDVQENRNRIRKMLFQNENYEYQPIDTSTFGFSLSPAAQLVSYSLIAKFKDETESKLLNIRENLISLLQELLKMERSLPALKKLFDIPRAVVTDADINENNITVITCSFEEAMKSMGIALPYNMFNDVIKFFRFSQFLENHRSDPNLEGSSPSICQKTYETLVAATEGFGRNCTENMLRRLSELLDQVYDSKLQVIPSYEQMTAKIQKDIVLFEELKSASTGLSFSDSITSFIKGLADSDLSECLEATDILVDYCSFYINVVARFLEDNSGRQAIHGALHITVQNLVGDLKSAATLFERLDALLKEMARSGVSADFNPADKLNDESPCTKVTKERLLKDLSQVKEVAQLRPSHGNKYVIIEGHVISASEVVSLLKTKSYDQVVLLATMAVKLDADLVLWGKHLLILAPKLVVLGSRKISLDGVHGMSYANAAGIGQPGYSGGHGGNGGHFSAAVLEIENPNGLEISVNGGNGGRGQDGGAGNGMDDPGLKGPDLRHDQVVRGNAWGIASPFGFDFREHVGNGQYFVAFGGPGQPGRAGAVGGDGGYGGGAGSIQFFSPKDTSLVRKSASPGVPGQGGSGGAGGPGGRSGAGLRVLRIFDTTRRVHKGGLDNFIKGKKITKTDIGALNIGESIPSEIMAGNGPTGSAGSSGSVSAATAALSGGQYATYAQGIDLFKNFVQNYEENCLLYERIQKMLKSFTETVA